MAKVSKEIRDKLKEVKPIPSFWERAKEHFAYARDTAPNLIVSEPIQEYWDSMQGGNNKMDTEPTAQEVVDEATEFNEKISYFDELFVKEGDLDYPDPFPEFDIGL